MEQSTENLSSLTPKQVRALPLLAAGETAAQVSKKLKISKQSLSEWRQNTNFMNALDEMRKESLNEAAISIRGLANDAVDTLKTLMLNASNEQLRLRAAMFLIEHLNLNSLGENSAVNEQCVGNQVNMTKLFDAIGISGN